MDGSSLVSAVLQVASLVLFAVAVVSMMAFYGGLELPLNSMVHSDPFVGDVPVALPAAALGVFSLTASLIFK